MALRKNHDDDANPHLKSCVCPTIKNSLIDDDDYHNHTRYVFVHNFGLTHFSVYHLDTFLRLICFVPYGNRNSIDLINYGESWRWTITFDDMIVFHHHNSHHRVIGLIIKTDMKSNGTAVLERPSSQMSYLDHFLKETGGNSGSTTHTNSGNLVS